MTPRPIPIAPALCCLILVASTSAGCGQAEGLERVSGTVRLDGEPIPDGSITFRDPEGLVGSDGGAILDGHYSFPATPGRKAVEITAIRDTGKTQTLNPGPEDGQDEFISEPLVEQYVPPQYNSRTTLTAEVTDGKNTIDFDLSSNP